MSVRSSLFSPNTLRTSVRIATAAITLGFLAGCAADAPGPTGLNARLDASHDGEPFTRGLVSPAWQETAGILVGQASYNAIQAAHAYPLLGVAQYLAVQRAEDAIDGGGRVRRESEGGAVAGASVVVLSYLFPTKVQMLEDMVTAQANADPGQPHPAFAAGEAIGRSVGAEIVTRARTDGFSNPNTAVPLVGPGYWVSSATPPLPVAGGQLPGVRRWFLTSADQFRPPPPPVFGSATFNAALAQVRQISDTRTARQIQIATYWAQPPGTPTTSGFWVGEATKGITEHGLSERRATHLYALLSATVFDAQIACWDAKLTYWLIRPWKADPAITVVGTVGKPNHPSYPSGHSCLSSAAAAVLTAFFPEKAARLEAMVVEAGMSRVYGGIHYLFDCETGQVLGRNVAAFTIAADESGESVLTAH